MKIGILSLVLHTNYGGILQSYALQTVLERMGHQVTVLNKDRDIHRSIFRRFLSYTKFIIYKYILKRDVSHKSQKQLNADRRKREQHTSAFIKQYIHTKEVNSITLGIFDDMDAIIVGSDQVWRPRYFRKQWQTSMAYAFLQFVKSTDTRRISYAASFGIDEWEYTDEETKQCSALLQKFSKVSVREQSGVELCREKLGRSDAVKVLDPTMLLLKDEYVNLITSAGIKKSKGNMLCYVLDMTEEKQLLIDKIADDNKLSPFYMSAKSLDYQDDVQPPVEQWLRGFMDAEFVVTDSFHACVFSVIFGKPFVVVGNLTRGMSRLESFLSMMSLEDHLMTSVSDYVEDKEYTIPQQSYERLAEAKNASMKFLNDALRL